MRRENENISQRVVAGKLFAMDEAGALNLSGIDPAGAAKQFSARSSLPDKNQANRGAQFRRQFAIGLEQVKDSAAAIAASRVASLRPAEWTPPFGRRISYPPRWAQ
jgi:hypothetical protein